MQESHCGTILRQKMFEVIQIDMAGQIMAHRNKKTRQQQRNRNHQKQDTVLRRTPYSRSQCALFIPFLVPEITERYNKKTEQRIHTIQDYRQPSR